MSHYDEERNLPEGEQLQEEKLLVEGLYKKKVKDKNGHHVGPVENVFVDDVHGQPEWITIRAGFMGMKTFYLPISALEEANDDELIAPWEKEIITESPTFKDVDGSLSKEQEIELFRYYNIDFVETSGGEEVLDEELVEAEEAGEINAPDNTFRAEDGEGENLVAIQEHMAEERRENLANGDGDNLLDEDLHREDRLDSDFDARDPEPLSQDDPEHPLRAGEFVAVESDGENTVVVDEAHSQEGEERVIVEEEAIQHRDETLEQEHEVENAHVTPVSMDDVVITRVEDGSVVHQGENTALSQEDVHGDLHREQHGEALEGEVNSEEEPYQPRHLKREDGE